MKPAYQLRYDRVEVPLGIYFGLSHTWAHLTESGFVRVGLDDFLKHIIGKIDSISVSEDDSVIKRGELLLEVKQNDKTLSIASPISGKIKRTNPEVINHPQSALSLSYNNRWVYELDPSNWLEEIKNLPLGSQACRWMKGEFIRLKDFFSNISPAQGAPAFAQVLQDGGEIAEKVLEYGDNDLWQKFQNDFLGNPIRPELTKEKNS